MAIPQELLELLDKHPGIMAKKMVEAYLQERSVEAIVEVAKAVLQGGETHDTSKT